MPLQDPTICQVTVNKGFQIIIIIFTPVHNYCKPVTVGGQARE